MLTIHHIASGSSGNAILVDDGVSTLLFDAGLSYNSLRKRIEGVGYKLSDVSGILITHEHNDHCKAVENLLLTGRPVYMSEGTAEAKGYMKSMLTTLINMEVYKIGNFIVKPFDVIHDAMEPMGFLFQSRSRPVKGVYIADTCDIPYRFSGVTHWIVECNYAESILDNNSQHEALKNRIRKSHMSLENIKVFFKGMKEQGRLSETKQITLVHLSGGNSDEAKFIKELQQTTGVPVYAPRN